MRLTYKTQGDATRSSHYCTGPGTKKDDVVQRLGEYEDIVYSPEELKSLLREARELLLAAIYANYKQTNAAGELCEKITQTIGRDGL